MALPRPVRSLPGIGTEETEPGSGAAELARFKVVTTLVIVQLWALTAALEAHLLDEPVEA